MAGIRGVRRITFYPFPDMTKDCFPITRDRVRAVCLASGTPFPESRFTDQALAGLEGYLALLEKWNRVMNLVGPSCWEDMLRILVADSFHLACFLESLSWRDTPECWDLGAGAGLPGIPLRLFWEQGIYTLVEPREKRALFLRTALAACPLPGVRVFQGRAEAFMPGRPPADLVVSRAFLPWEKVLALIAPHMAPSGRAVFLTLAPAPEALPAPWAVTAQTRYVIAGGDRYFWALTNCTE